MLTSMVLLSQIISSTFRGVNEPTRLHHINTPLFTPITQPVPVNTLMCSLISYWHQTVLRPFICHNSNVSMTHGCLSKEVQTVLYGPFVSGLPKTAEIGATVMYTINFSLFLAKVCPVYLGVTMRIQTLLKFDQRMQHAERSDLAHNAVKFMEHIESSNIFVTTRNLYACLFTTKALH